MADIGLDRADAAEPGLVGGFLEGLRQSGNLDGIAQIGAGAVAFDVVNRVGVDASHGLRFGHGCGLTLH